MKNRYLFIFQTIFLCLSSSYIFAQVYDPCGKELLDDRYQIARNLEKQGKFGEAIKEYMAIMVICPKEAGVAGKKIDQAVSAIEELRINAEQRKIMARQSMSYLQVSLRKAKEAEMAFLKVNETLEIQSKETELKNKHSLQLLENHNKLIKALYFYKDSIALAYNEKDKYYYINKSGDRLDYLGKNYQSAANFDENGWAYVTKEGSEFILHATGNKYIVATSLSSITNQTQALDLRGKYRKVLPDSIFDFHALEVLLLSSNGLKSISPKVSKLKNLKILDLSDNWLDSLPKELTTLDSLRHLTLNRTNLKSLPEELGNLKNLTFLSINNFPSDSLPPSITNLENLETLQLNDTKIKFLPSSLGALINLRNLEITGNILDSLPISIGKLKNLQKITLTSGKLSKIPSSISDLINLEHLDISYNKLQDLPDSFGLLNNLKTLHLNNNQLTTLPYTFGKLVNLVNVDLNNNKLSSLPESFGSLSHLELLNLNYNKLSVLPNSFGNLASLVKLNLQFNTLTQLPENFGNLSNLVHLDLTYNQINFLPENFGRLIKLEKLNLLVNKIKSLPKTFSYLLSLQEVDLSRNQIQVLPDDFGKLVSLRKLALNDNQLKVLPESIGELKNLESGNFGNNKLEILPNSIENLKKIEHLVVSNNNLKSLTHSITKMNSLRYLYISNNDSLDFEQLKDILSQIKITIDFNPADFSKIDTTLHVGLNSFQIISLINQNAIDKIKALSKIRNLSIEDSFSIANLPAICKIKGLEYLYISNVSILSFPEELINLRNLKNLFIHTVECDTLPKQIYTLKNLEVLRIYDTPIRNLSSEIGKLKELTHLEILQPKLTSIPPEIGMLEKLKFLSIDSDSLSSLPDEIINLKNLETLYLHNTLLTEHQFLNLANNNSRISNDLIKERLKYANLEAGANPEKADTYKNCFELEKKYGLSISTGNIQNNAVMANILAGKIEQAYSIVSEAMIKFPSNKESLETKLVLCLLLLDRWKEARKILIRTKDLELKWNKAYDTYQKYYLDKITELETKGIHSKSFDKAKKALIN